MSDLFALGAVDDAGEQVRHTPPRHYFVQTMSDGAQRLRIGAQGLDTLRLLLPEAPEPFWLLYVLVIARGNEPGRYQSPKPLSRQETTDLLDDFGDYLASDGRHNLWLKSVHGPELLVFDRHQLLYAYGNLDHFRQILESAGYTEGEVPIPSPHIHYYHPANDPEQRRLVAHLNWVQTPLQDSDDEP